MKCIIFRVRSQFARFRKPYTTTSALTYLLIHPVAVRGLIGGILGIDRKDLHKETKDIDVGIQVINTVKKDMQSFNLLNMKSNDKIFRFPSNIEFLRDVNYRIFIKGQEDKINEIRDTLIDGEFVFTPYLGASEHIAKIEYEDEFPCIKLEKSYQPVKSAIDVEACNIDFDDNEIALFTDNIPVMNNDKREYIKYKKVMFAQQNNTIKCESDEFYKIGDDIVMFL